MRRSQYLIPAMRSGVGGHCETGARVDRFVEAVRQQIESLRDA
jgi:hypothetical protein